MSDNRVDFTRSAAERIANVVRVVEGGDRDGQPLRFGKPVQSPSTVRTFRIATFTGEWSIGSAKTVTFKNQTNTPNTASATNLFWPIPDSGTRDCSIARDGTAWYLLVPQLFSVEAATSATLTTAALEFNTIPVVALATVGTNMFSVVPITIEPVVGVTLTSDSLSFTRKSVGVFFESTADTVSISITTCATATT